MKQLWFMHCNQILQAYFMPKFLAYSNQFYTPAETSEQWENALVRKEKISTG